MAAIGTANLDNRSFRLNFVVTTLFIDREFNREVSRMLLRDFSNSSLYASTVIQKKSLGFKIMMNVARLFSPVL